ncbi:MAG: hypothetical protein KBB86_02525 [Candidatus Pacebacteria bacterium]|nr:hypothetical protein [Candidatus Paceibacterota bacterium]
MNTQNTKKSDEIADTIVNKVLVGAEEELGAISSEIDVLLNDVSMSHNDKDEELRKNKIDNEVSDLKNKIISDFTKN